MSDIAGKTWSTRIRLAAAGMVLAASAGAAAADLSAAGSGDAPNASTYRVRMALNDNEITVCLFDAESGAPVRETLEVDAIVRSAQDETHVHLRPAGGNCSSGRGRFILDPRMRVSIQVRSSGQPLTQASFEPMKRVAYCARLSGADLPRLEFRPLQGTAVPPPG